MENIIKQRKYKRDLSTFKQRRHFMERVISTISNELTEGGLSPGERSKLYTALNASMKILADSEKDSILLDIETRLNRLEKGGK